MITKEDWDRLREQLVEDPRQVFITNETFQLLFSVITVWRPDLKQESEALIDELQTLSKLEPPVAFNDRRVLVLMGKYSEVIEKITEEIMLRKEYIELSEEDESLWNGYGRNVE
jgi:hypothetical protein